MTELEERVLESLGEFGRTVLDLDVACHLGEDLDEVRDALRKLGERGLAEVYEATSPSCGFAGGGQEYVIAGPVEHAGEPGVADEDEDAAG